MACAITASRSTVPTSAPPMISKAAPRRVSVLGAAVLACDGGCDHGVALDCPHFGAADDLECAPLHRFDPGVREELLEHLRDVIGVRGGDRDPLQPEGVCR